MVTVADLLAGHRLCTTQFTLAHVSAARAVPGAVQMDLFGEAATG